ncbi:MAG TPA: hypothetical protein VGR06_12260, partial [Actinophytocola sp.]|uniref:hypothetical protein n=1 Tax=Actinophytocola sp. TaxID=1872138 RepID=UPI002E00E483|nr:hypothetical protein [Actinophytocola sp.]
DRLLRLLLRRFADNLGEQAGTRRADLGLFPRAIDPRWLTRPRPYGVPTLSRWGVREHLAGSWRAVLTYRDADLDVDLGSWLDAGIEDGNAALLDVLVDAAAGRFRPIAVLTAGIRRWARFGEGNRAAAERIARELAERLESTQGLMAHKTEGNHQ